MTEYIDIVVETPPGPESQFVEVEDDNGKSVRIGQWIAPTDGDPFWRLRIGRDEIGKL